MENQPKSIPGKGGHGTLIPVVKGGKGAPGAGRKPNPFRHYIQEMAEGEKDIVLKGRLIGEDGQPCGDPVDVVISLPGAMGIALRAYKQAVKGDAAARKWLTETGWGKSLNIGFDPDNPVEGGFAIILPPNDR